jgi:hypothetical protein
MTTIHSYKKLPTNKKYDFNINGENHKFSDLRKSLPYVIWKNIYTNDYYYQNRDYQNMGGYEPARCCDSNQIPTPCSCVRTWERIYLYNDGNSPLLRKDTLIDYIENLHKLRANLNNRLGEIVNNLSFIII